jgi:TonB family protein
MSLQKLLCVSLMCFGLSLVYAAAQTQPAAGPPAAAPATPSSPAKAAAAPLPDPKTPAEFFARARQLSDLEASGIPFHLKATYVASGDTEFTGNGTYEEWWQSKDLWRKEATLGDYKYVEIQYGGKNTVYGSSDYIPLRLRQMLDAVLIRSAPDTGTASEWKIKKKTLNHVELIVLSSDGSCGDNDPKSRCVAQDYMTPSGVLRLRTRVGAENVYNNFHAFRGFAVPANIAVSRDGVVIVNTSIQSLESLTPGETESLKNTSPPASLQSVPAVIDLTSEPNARMPKPIHAVSAQDFADEDHPRGSTIVIDMKIDGAGRVREPFVIQSAGRLLDESELDAVRKWRFSPTIIDGVPVCVHARVSIMHTVRYFSR